MSAPTVEATNGAKEVEEKKMEDVQPTEGAASMTTEASTAPKSEQEEKDKMLRAVRQSWCIPIRKHMMNA